MTPAHTTILVVEDDRASRTFLADNLTADGYDVLEAATARDAMEPLGTRFPDLAIVDLGLPDADGLEVLVQIREADRLGGGIDPDMPVLILTGRGSEVELLRGFERGADDYLVKPYSYFELQARIVSLLRRTSYRPALGRLRVGPLELDPLGRQVWLRKQSIPLSKKEFALLRTLAGEPTRVFTREELLRGVWGYRDVSATRTLDSHASRLRKKLRSQGDPLLINVWGVGYRLIDGGAAA
jgi:DNA-binding response OmpR family regulator